MLIRPTNPTARTALVAVVIVVLTLGACGGESDKDAEPRPSDKRGSMAPSTTTSDDPASDDPASDDPTSDDPTTDGSTTDTEAGGATTPAPPEPSPASLPSTAPASSALASPADEFPVTIQHKFGETTIDARPTRIVSVGYHEQDYLASLGTPPIMAREWIGSIVNHWAEDAFGGVEPEPFERTEIPFERIAAAEPDLIVGVYSWIDEDEYQLLSRIAPTLAQSGDVDDGQMSWEDQLLLIAEATGGTDRAHDIIADIDAAFAAERAAHPEWEGKTIGILSDGGDGTIGAYTSGDPRMRFLGDLGFDTTALDEFSTATDQGFWVTFSPENLDLLGDLDVVVWYNPDTIDRTIADTMPFHAEGREIWVGDTNWHLFGFQSSLSIPAALEFLVPEIDAAVDGDPTTVVPTADAAGIAP